MRDGLPRQLTVDGIRTQPPTDAEVLKARQAVAQRSESIGECRDLLAMLGLDDPTSLQRNFDRHNRREEGKTPGPERLKRSTLNDKRSSVHTGRMRKGVIK